MKHPPPPATTPGQRLEPLAKLAEAAGANALADEARALAERVRGGHFYAACLGQFKRGKSTLLNALVGEPVLPVGVVPVTAVVTVLRHGPRRTARVRFAGGDHRDVPIAQLAQYVTEEQNPGNAKGVAAVEVFLPSALLASGMCLVDTPGVGSVFSSNTEATSAFVPHVDAALVVLGADPPISADELALVRQVAAQCGEVLFVLNKADKLSETDLREADRFTRRILAEQVDLPSIRMFHVSAAERLAGQGPPRDWAALVEALERLATARGGDLVEGAAARGFARLARRLRRHIDEQRDALLRPVEASQRRVDALQASVGAAEQALGDLDYLFAAEQDRLARAFADIKAQFLERARTQARDELAEACRAHAARRGPALRRAAIALAKETATRYLDAWLAEAERTAEGLYVRAMDRFVALSNDFLRQLRESGDPALTDLPESVNPEVGFRWDSRLFYKDLFEDTVAGPLTWVADVFRTRAASLRSVDAVAGDYLVRLLETNATRIENDLNERVLESRRRFAFELRSLLRGVVDSAASSLKRARAIHAKGHDAVHQELRHLDALRERLDVLAG